MKGNDYLRYMTEQVVTYLDLPKEEKRKRKKRYKRTNDVYQSRWFGVLPFTFKLWYKKRNGK
ncbi:YqzE family protein [Oceanobacillus iheyensis]|uniref:YqzE family protein n=1 Tax=Oceanobacillus iheyensis TaxID=182710 RepID=UPI003641459D